MQVKELMVRDPITVATDTPLSTALSLMDEHGIRHLPVLRGSSLVGVLSDRDLLGELGWVIAPDGGEPLLANASAGDLLRREPLTVGPGESIVRAAELMASERIGCTPVCESDALLGLLTETDLLEAFMAAARYGRLSAGEDPEVGDVMRRDEISVEFDAGPSEAMRAMLDRDLRHLLVMDGERRVGVLSERDLRCCARPGAMQIRCAGEICSRDVRIARPDERLSVAALRMVNDKIGALVVENTRGRTVGILTVTDVLAFCARAPGWNAGL